MARKKKTTTKKKSSHPKWIIVYTNYGYDDTAITFSTDKYLQDYLLDSLEDVNATIYRIDSATKFQYEIPALSGVLKEVK